MQEKIIPRQGIMARGDLPRDRNLCSRLAFAAEVES